MTNILDHSDQDEVLYDPLDGVVLHDRPCPPGQNPEQAIREQEEIAGLRPMAQAEAEEEQSMLLRMLSSTIEDADSRIADLGQAGGDHYWQGKAEAVALGRRGVSFDEIAEAIGHKPERIARLFTNRTERVTKMLAAERYVRGGEWDGDIKSVMAMSDLPRATALLFLANIGVDTNAAASRKRGGGHKYTAEQYEAIRHMRCDMKWSWKQIEKHTGIKDSTAIKIAQRQGWV